MLCIHSNAFTLKIYKKDVINNKTEQNEISTIMSRSPCPSKIYITLCEKKYCLHCTLAVSKTLQHTAKKVHINTTIFFRADTILRFSKNSPSYLPFHKLLFCTKCLIYTIQCSNTLSALYFFLFPDFIHNQDVWIKYFSS